MSSDSSSELSDVPSEVEDELQLKKKNGILKFFSKAPSKAAPKAESPPRPKRDPSPPHEFVLADNQDIAVSRYHCLGVLHILTRRKRVFLP